MKRSIDVVVCGFLMALLLPVFAAVATLVRVLDGPPVFYVGRRVGQWGREFDLYKFRSMRANTGSSVTISHDPRVTRLGRVLRRTKLDELPQLLNVVKGDMSLVGPRPEDPDYVALYSSEQRRILDFKPGITSVSALTYLDEESSLSGPDWEAVYREQIMPAKIELELSYQRRRTLLSDVGVLARTAAVPIRRLLT
jgi:lipopolysaccharide/colanic/teichoic acid biosynthesis glycosyltransferase